MRFETGEHYTRRSNIKNHDKPILIELTHWARKDESETCAIITMDIGACHVHADLTPNEARDLATNLQAYAEEVEAHQRQLDEVTA